MGLRTTTALLLTATAFLCAAPRATATTDITVEWGSYSWWGTFKYFSKGPSKSYMDPNGRGKGYYRYGFIEGEFSNNEPYQSGSVVGAFWISSYIGADTGWRVCSRNWGSNYAYVFDSYESWTCKKYGYRKRIKRYGYASIGSHEYDGSWPMTDELSFESSYRKW